MIERGETSISIRETVPAGVDDLFAILADPRRHIEIDGSAMLRPTSGTTLLTVVGQVFTMEMTYPALGDYRTDNRVLEFEPGRRITWTTSREGQPPAGVWWSWELGADGSGATTVVHTYDWSRVHDPAVLARVNFPRVSAEQLQASVERLAGAAAGTRDGELPR